MLQYLSDGRIVRKMLLEYVNYFGQELLERKALFVLLMILKYLLLLRLDILGNLFQNLVVVLHETGLFILLILITKLIDYIHYNFFAILNN